MYSQNRLQIIPKKNLISNIGCSKDATHGDELKLLPKGLRRIFNMKTYELEFPLKHAKYVIPDIDYENKRNKIMGYNAPIVYFFRKIEIVCLRLIYGDFDGIKLAIERRIGHKKNEK